MSIVTSRKLVFSRQTDRNYLDGDDNFETERLVCDRIATMKHGENGPKQWSNYDGARGGLAHLKDLAASAKHLF